MPVDLAGRVAGARPPAGPEELVPVPFDRVDHRPWPLPDRRWAWRQSWRDLLFAHWPIRASELRPWVPPALEIEEFDGTSWLGVVAFRMCGVSPRGLPDLPWVSAFPELNVRLYVTCDGKPGVWFLSLDAGNPVAVWAARRFFHLPYFRARMQVKELPGRFSYRSVRLSPPRGIQFGARYDPASEPHEAAPGSLERWLTERYCLYAMSPHGALFRADVHHPPWRLQRAEAEVTRNDLFKPFGLAVSESPLLLHFSRRLDVLVWSLERIRG